MKKRRFVGAALTAALWLVLAAVAWFHPVTEISEAERRKLEAFPALSVETVLSGRFMSKFESYAQDQFPFRDRFRQVKALFSYDILHKGDNNGIYLVDGVAAKLEYPLNERSVQGAIEKFTKIREQYLMDSEKIVFSIVPDKGYYLAGANGYPAMDYGALFDTFWNLEWAEYADITDCLTADSYYRTDTHWRQETLLPVAQKLGEALGVNLPEEYHLKFLERPFYGVYYGQAALPMEPERIGILTSDILEQCRVTNAENDRVTKVYDLDKLESRDLYDVFLSGAVSVLDVENPAGEGRELLIFRDSFGSSLVPLLIPGYSRVTLIDTRYVPTAYLDRFVDFHGQDVLFLYSPLVLNNSAMLK